MNIILAFFIAVSASVVPPLQTDTEITYCKFDIPDVVKTGNMSFYLHYGFEIDDQGQPVKIMKIRDEFIGVDQVTACIQNWRFRGLKMGTKLVAQFRWSHGKGWVSIVVTGPNGFKQSVKFPAPCSP